MDDRLAADIRIDVSDLTQTDLDELTARLEDAVAPFRGTVTVDTRSY